MKGFALLLVMAVLPILSSCASLENTKIESINFIAMDTINNISIYNTQEDIDTNIQLDNAKQIVLDIQQQMNAHDEHSTLYKINQNSTQSPNISPLSSELYEVIDMSLKVSALTKGALDVTVFELMQAWGFSQEQPQVPSDEKIQEALEKTSYKNIELDKESMSITAYNHVKLDLGAVAKGYAAQAAADYLQQSKVSAGIISLGGNIQLFGQKPDKSLWKIAIQDPFDAQDTAAAILAKDGAIVTSGNYQRQFRQDNTAYHHILDPHTGMPSQSGLASVTIITKNGAYADALSTALFVCGLQEGIEIWRSQQDFQAVFITQDNKMYITEGLEGQMDNLNPKYQVEIISYQ